MSILKDQTRTSKDPRGTGRVIFDVTATVRDNQTGEVYQIEVRFENTRTGESRLIGVPVKRCYDNGEVETADWTTDLLYDALQRELLKWNTPNREWIYRPRRIMPPGPSVPLSSQQWAELRRKLQKAGEPKRVPIAPRPEPGATEPDDPRPLPTGDLSDRPAPPRADAAFFEAESKTLKGA